VELSQRRKELTVPTKADVDDATRDALVGLSRGDETVLDEMADIRRAEQQSSGLDPRTFSLVKIAALIAVDAPPASYLWQVANALDSGATPQDMVGVLRAVTPHVGGPRAMAAAPELMVALGLELPSGA
jgi:4-carboxymuconolactone decarboxylase